jgi:hypothetical protein
MGFVLWLQYLENTVNKCTSKCVYMFLVFKNIKNLFLLDDCGRMKSDNKCRLNSYQLKLGL